MRPGEIYKIHLSEEDQPLSEEDQHRVVVVSREKLNRGEYVVVVSCTSRKFAARSGMRNCVPFRAGRFGFTKDSVAQCESIASLEKARLDLDRGPIATLDASSMRDMIRAIGYVIDSECEPL